MKLKTVLVLAMCFGLAFASTANAQFNGYGNKGLVGVGRIPANSFDRLGTNVDTLGGVFSALALEPNSLIYFDDAAGNIDTVEGRLLGLPDRGFGDGAQDYHPRLERFSLALTPYYGTTPISNQNQVRLTNTQTVLLTYGNGNFTGFDANDPSVQAFPQSMPNSLGQGKRSLDPEGLAFSFFRNSSLTDGYWVSDEYGANIYRFNLSGLLQQTLPIPAALVPKVGAAFPRPNNFNGSSAPTVGRNNNRGFEGLSLTPDRKRLVAMLQSPTVQDSGGASTNNSLNTRILIYDVDVTSPTVNQLVGEYVYVLTNQGSAAGRSTPISEIYALNNYQFLILERDNIGLGGTDGVPRYKKVNLADVSAATNIAGSGFDLEVGAPGARQLPATTLPANVIPAARQDFVDIIDNGQLVKFNLNATAARDQNSLAEKWEGLSLIPAFDAATPNDYFLLVGNDNDFKAATVYHNGIVVGTNNPTVDSMILAYRVTLPSSRGAALRQRDFDGDGKSDLAVFRPSNGVWYAERSSNRTLFAQQFGLANDKLAPADFDGDDITDLAVFRDGIWFIQSNSSKTVRTVQFGQTGDVPVPADYDGDGKADITVFRPSNGVWYSLKSFNNQPTEVQFGQSGDVPAAGDYNGDSSADIAVFRPSNGIWYIQPSNAAAGSDYQTVQFGQDGDVPVAGDYDGDGRTDLAVFRSSNGFWYQLNSRGGFVQTQFGQSGDAPVTGDYDGDGKNDLAVFRSGVWYVLNSSNNTIRMAQFGLSDDVPVQ